MPTDAVRQQLGPIASVLWSLAELQPIIEGASEAAMADLEASLEWSGIPGGTTLFHQGDIAKDAFIVATGRLGVFVDAGLGTRLVAQIRPGEMIGEMALISGEPRSATVVALRDSEVVRIPADAAERLMSTSPQLMVYMIRLLVGRLKGTHGPLLKQATKTIAVMPIDAQVLGRDFGDGLHKEFLSLTHRVGLLDGTNSQLTTESIGLIEADHDLVVYLADRRGSTWSRRCLRQADRVIFIANADATPDHEADQEIAAARRLQRPADLMLLNREDCAEPDGASAWLGRLTPDRIFNVRRGNAADYARVARLITGRAIGLVLSGGGARGFAHVGAIRALRACGIPIDLVGGTSMGSIVAAGVAYDAETDEIARQLRASFVDTNPISDYTLPFYALSRGRKMARLLRHACGDRLIENAWKIFFCVSANLSTGTPMIHQRGLMWRALRASVAIPGIVPPYVEQGEVMVDGGIINNFPADIMSSLARGPVIGVEVTAGSPFYSKVSDIEEKSLFWLLRKGRNALPGIFSLLMRAGTINSGAQTIASCSHVDLLIQPDLGPIDMMSFHAFDIAVEGGYRATMEAIERLDKPLI